MRKMLKQINAAPLTPELMQSAMEAIADLPAEDRRDMTARMLAVIRVLNDQLPERDGPAVGMAINFRLMALARMMSSEALPGFRLPAHADGPDLLHEDAVRAAVEVPLRLKGEDLVFDPVEFRDHLLAIASPAGKA